MITLANPHLRVLLLDPSSPADQHLLGSRFCWGGYVWQVRDARGDLLSGPEYPAPAPDPFNGQGLPEAFRCRDRETGAPLTLAGGRGFVIGAGEVELDRDGGLRLVGPAAWDRISTPEALDFTCRQRFADWSTVLDRRIELQGRTLISATRLRNAGSTDLPIHWFPHPFFPLVRGRARSELPAGYRVADNPAFTVAAGVLQQRVVFSKGDPGHFQPLVHPPTPLVATVAHPRLGGIRMSCDYGPAEVPVWANHATVSLEPYLHAVLPAGGERAWRISYEFLPSP